MKQVMQVLPRLNHLCIKSKKGVEKSSLLLKYVYRIIRSSFNPDYPIIKIESISAKDCRRNGTGIIRIIRYRMHRIIRPVEISGASLYRIIRLSRLLLEFV